jgi:hypothetical protein
MGDTRAAACGAHTRRQARCMWEHGSAKLHGGTVTGQSCAWNAATVRCVVRARQEGARHVATSDNGAPDPTRCDRVGPGGGRVGGSWGYCRVARTRKAGGASSAQGWVAVAPLHVPAWIGLAPVWAGIGGVRSLWGPGTPACMGVRPLAVVQIVGVWSVGYHSIGACLVIAIGYVGY